MNIEKMTVVSVLWSLQDTLGQVLDQSSDPTEFLVGGQDLLPKIEEGLMGKQAGDSVWLQLEPQDAFGDFDETQIVLEARDRFPQETEAGMIFEHLPAGCKAQHENPVSGFWHVTDVYEEHVILDGNHPLAGMAIRVKFDIQSVRPALPKEIDAQSAGAGFFKLA